MSQNFVEVAFTAMKWFVPFLFALCFHEFAHGFVARMRGDRTAELQGRLTLNPMAHADPLGTFILPLLAIVTHFPFFGWAKPVPVDERNLKNPKVDMFWIAFAGPLSNILLAFIGAIGLGLYVRFNGAAISAGDLGARQIMDVAKIFISINVFLAVFNMIPLHPLDGGKVLARFLPDHVNRKLEDMQPYTSMLLLLLFVTGLMSVIAIPADGLNSLFISLANGVLSV